MIEIKKRFTGGILLSVDAADLSSADLRSADLRSADFSSANLSKARLSWHSHDLLSEVLKRSSGDDIAKLKIAGLLLVCHGKCWPDFLALDDPLTDWALDTLAEWVQDGDGAPPEVAERVKKAVAT